MIEHEEEMSPGARLTQRLENIEAKLHELLSLVRSLWMAEERRAAIAAATKPQREA